MLMKKVESENAFNYRVEMEIQPVILDQNHNNEFWEKLRMNSARLHYFSDTDSQSCKLNYCLFVS